MELVAKDVGLLAASAFAAVADGMLDLWQFWGHTLWRRARAIEALLELAAHGSTMLTPSQHRRAQGGGAFGELLWGQAS